MRSTPMIVGSCALVLLGTVGLVLGCGAGDDGKGEVVEVVEGQPGSNDATEPGRTAERLDARRLPASETVMSALREVPLSMELAIDPDNDFYLAKALEPEAPGTVHLAVYATTR